ncbi:hypothetical protein [Streptomyces sp. WELS2]|uniref:hypothetical protein n=1 Tax=Streptomyces sp. WELS2 TaxID=2749435 RepID=UPI0015F06ED7|nr:hypothetical protein [Streptomyces sp. WELS2]
MPFRGQGRPAWGPGLTECARLGTEQLADTVLARLGVPSGGRNDIASIVVRL